MDAVEFLKTLGRMCNVECTKCEFQKRRSNFESCSYWQETHPEEAVAIVEQWAKEHPIKTRQSEFLEHYPSARRILAHGCLNACPMDVFKDADINCNAQPCHECKKDFWLAEVEDT